jgi:hypothetical protein
MARGKTRSFKTAMRTKGALSGLHQETSRKIQKNKKMKTSELKEGDFFKIEWSENCNGKLINFRKKYQYSKVEAFDFYGVRHSIEKFQDDIQLCSEEEVETFLHAQAAID